MKVCHAITICLVVFCFEETYSDLSSSNIEIIVELIAELPHTFDILVDAHDLPSFQWLRHQKQNIAAADLTGRQNISVTSAGLRLLLESTLSDEPRLYILELRFDTSGISKIKQVEDFLRHNERFRSCSYFIFVEPQAQGEDLFHLEFPKFIQRLAIDEVSGVDLPLVSGNVYFWTKSHPHTLVEVCGIDGNIFIRSNDNFYPHSAWGFILFKTGRRSNFEGSNITVFITDELYDERAGSLKPHPDDYRVGFFVHGIEYLRQALNFRINTVPSTGTVSQGPNGTLLGVARQLNDNQGDIDIGGAELIEYRVKGPDALTYLVPMHSYSILAYFTQPPRSSAVHVYSLPFQPGVWAGLLFVCVLTSGFILLSEALSRERFVATPGDALILTCNSFSLQGWHVSPPFVPTRASVVVASLTAIVLYAAYSALLVSFFTIQSQPVKKFDDILTYEYFLASESKNPTSGLVVAALEAEKQIKKFADSNRRKGNSSTMDTIDAILEARLALVSTPPIFTPAVSALHSDAFICSHILNVPVPIVAPRKGGYLIRKWSPFREHFNAKLTLARERGVVHEWARRRQAKVEIKCEAGFKFKFMDISLKDSCFAFYLVVLGTVTSVFIFFMEKLVAHIFAINKLT